MGYMPAGWLCADIIDMTRLLEGRKQKFGTQFGKQNGQWRLLPFETGTTDEERALYRVLPLKEIKRLESKLNSKKGGRMLNPQIIGLTMIKKSSG